MDARVVAVARSAAHRFSKTVEPRVTLLEGLGIVDDAHAGVTVKHRSRVARDPSQPNLRQVHLIPTEVLDELKTRGFRVEPGALGENITTAGVDLHALPVGTRLHIGGHAVVTITGLRNPCSQIEDFHEGLLAAVVDRDADGHVHRKTGVMSVVTVGGVVSTGDPIRVELPPRPHAPLEVV